MYAYTKSVILIAKSKYIIRLKRINYEKKLYNLYSTLHQLSNYIIA